MATIAVQKITRGTGLNPPVLVAAAAAGDEFVNDGRTFAWIENAHASASRTITFISQVTLDDLNVNDLDIGVSAANDRAFVGPFPPHIYNDANGKVQVTYSDSGADITIGFFNGV